MKLLSWLGSVITILIGCFAAMICYDALHGYLATRESQKKEG